MIDHQKRLMLDKTKGDAMPTCRLLAAGKEFAGKQGHLCAPGISRQSAGAQGVHLQIVGRSTCGILVASILARRIPRVYTISISHGRSPRTARIFKISHCHFPRSPSWHREALPGKLRLHNHAQATQEDIL